MNNKTTKKQDEEDFYLQEMAPPTHPHFPDMQMNNGDRLSTSKESSVINS